MNRHDQHNDPCQQFLDQLDEWLGQALDSQQSAFMQEHQDSCPACQVEARLAREIDAIAQNLPAQQCPELQLPKGRQGNSAPTPGKSLLGRLLETWRQPLVFGPAIALLLLLGVFVQTQRDYPEPPLIVVNGESYTPEEVLAAAEELETALEYLRRYSNYPAMLVSNELRETSSLKQQSDENNAGPSI